MRADMIRYVILELFGGLYLDLDYEFFRPFDLLHERIVLPRESDPGEDVVLGNCVLASEPGHPFWGLALKEMEKTFSSLGREPLEEDVIWLTGPGLLTRTYQKYSHADASIYIPPRSSFHPRTPRDRSEYAAIRQIPGVYGVHHCAGTWRANSLAQKLGRKILQFRVSAREKRKSSENGADRT
jgi:mannosyltransferase OCH1-like enzyme